MGAGPGDPELLTVKAHGLLRKADVVLHDRLVSAEVLALIPRGKERINVGKAAGSDGGSQAELNALMIERARRGQTVVRLKGGDPYVFGRGGEEALELWRAGIAFEVVPGISSATAAPAAAGIPLTHRDLASVVVIATGHEGEGKAGAPVDWEAIGRIRGTLVILMGVDQAETILMRLMKGGLAPATPAAVVERGTTPRQRVIVGTVGNIAAKAKRSYVEPPALFVLGDVVALRQHLGAGP